MLLTFVLMVIMRKVSEELFPCCSGSVKYRLRVSAEAMGGEDLPFV